MIANIRKKKEKSSYVQIENVLIISFFLPQLI